MSINIDPWKPRYSQQLKGERNCGLHVVSMITHLPVDFLMKEFKKYAGTITNDVRYMLWFFGVESADYQRFAGTLPTLCVLHVLGHWCLHHVDTTYDSCLGIFPTSEKRADRRKIIGFIPVKQPE